MRQLFIVFLVLLPFLQHAQTIVSTDPQNKNVILEKYTGIRCVFCPNGELIANQIYNNNPGRVVIISVHAGAFANPKPGQPDFRTKFGQALVSLAGVNGYPAGSVNRHVFPGMEMTSGKTAMDREHWSNAANLILQQPSCVNVGAVATIDTETRKLTVNVEAYYTANSDAYTNKINVVLLQDNTVGPQAGGSANYVHNHRLIHMITGQWGEKINTTTEGTLYQNSFTYTIPQAHNQVPIVLSDLKVAVFISKNNEEIYTGVEITPQLGQLPEIDYMISYDQPLDIWDGNIEPKITLKSTGKNAITQMSFEYKIDSQTEHTHTWNGTVGFGDTVIITLPKITFDTSEVNVLQVKALTQDATPQNNIITVNLHQAPIAMMTDIVIEVKPDKQGHQIKWFIKDENGVVKHKGGNYPPDNLTLKEHEVTVVEGKYTLEVQDMGENGIQDGYVKLKTGEMTVIDIPGNAFLDKIAKKFVAKKIYEINIDPINGTTNVSGTGPYTIACSHSLYTMSQEPINEDNVNSIVKLRNNQGETMIEYTATISDDKKHITIIPNTAIPDRTVVRLELLGKSQDGFILKKVSTFTVGTGSNITESSSDAISLFPNPARTQFTVSGIEHGEVRIYTVSGQLIVNEQINANEPVILPNNTKGVVLVKITTDNKSIVKQLVVE